MRLESLYLLDIVEAADHLAGFLHGIDQNEFEYSELLRSAVVQKLITIGEAASRLSVAFRENHPHIPWPQIIAFRNILVHAYFGIEWEIVWRAAAKRCPVLRDQVVEILTSIDGTAENEHIS